MRSAAGNTHGAVSSGRWYQLETGVQKAGGQEIHISTTAATVAAAARAVDWDIDAALTLAGFDPTHYTPPPTARIELAELSTDELLAEIRRRIPADNPQASAWEVVGTDDPRMNNGQDRQNRHRL